MDNPDLNHKKWEDKSGLSEEEFLEAMEEFGTFSALIDAVGRMTPTIERLGEAANTLPRTSLSSKQDELHRKAVSKRKKRKRGGHK